MAGQSSNRPRAWRTAARAPVAAAFVCASVFAAAGPALADDASDMSAQELADAAKKELTDAKSVHVRLTERTDERELRTPSSFDLRLDEDGNCTGSLTMGTGGADGGSLDLVKRGDEVWMKPDATFWKAQVPGGAGELAAQLFDGRYVHGTTDDPMLDGLSDVCDLDSFRGELENGSGDSGPENLTKGDETTVRGTDVVPLTGREHSKDFTLYVASDEPHQLVRATVKGSGESVTMTLTDYGKPVPDKTPSADQSVDISKLRDMAPGETPGTGA
ncbi:LppX_LprAFG lipoprotein [Streptomyces sp. NPDC050145]|uniref:LppX_LprAFG lipoprotein n=1 Tax=Streptomyces sp. NPDC050145 TaxID=3365602 RepID=UPI0037B6A4E8